MNFVSSLQTIPALKFGYEFRWWNVVFDGGISLLG